MRVSSFLLSTVARNVADAATASAPVTVPATEATPAPAAATPVAAKPAKRVLAKPGAKPANGKPAKPVTGLAKPAGKAKPATEAAKPSANVTRTAATIAAQACNFGNLSDRDTTYMRFYASLAKRAANGVVTLRGIVDSGHARVPGATFASAKPHDAGVIQRLAKAGLLSIRDNGAAFVFTKAAHTHAAYVAGFGKPA